MDGGRSPYRLRGSDGLWRRSHDADVKRAAGLGCEWLTFDMPNADVPGMLAVIERFAKEVKPAAA